VTPQSAERAASGFERDPIAVFCRARASEKFLWFAPSSGRARVALGARAAIATSGEKRFDEAAQALRAMRNKHCGSGLDALPLVGGFSFAPATSSEPEWSAFPDLRFALADSVLEIESGEARWLGTQPTATTFTPSRGERELGTPLAELGEPLAIASDAGPGAYRERVAAALRAIERGELEKVVVARRLRVTRPGGFDPERLLRALAERHPSCTLFALARGGSIFLGASPEPLLALRDGIVETAALAGSTARGNTPNRDRELARELLASPKERAEHAAVLRAIQNALAPIAREQSAPAEPALRRLDGIQHLESRVRATLADPLSLLEVAARLHPTPSIAGAPADAALRWLARREGLARGWYAGAVGLVDAQGEGELCVALRCALLRGDEALLYAGAGVVAGSDPEAELQETRLKLRALLDPLLEV
jgi:isochorismate synthase